MQPKEENAPSLRSGFRNDSEALYVPTGSSYGSMSAQELSVHQTVERYNIVNSFLNKLGMSGGEKTRDFAQHILLKMLPMVKGDDIADLE